MKEKSFSCHRIIPDRIEAGTFLIAGALTGGALSVTHCEPKHLTAVLQKMREAGVDLRVNDNTITVIGGVLVDSGRSRTTTKFLSDLSRSMTGRGGAPPP